MNLLELQQSPLLRQKLSQEMTHQTPIAPPNLLNDLFGGKGYFDRIEGEPGYAYGSILPFKRNIATGEVSMALPEIAREAVNALLAPGRALYGQASDEDAVNLAMTTMGGGLLSSLRGSPARGTMSMSGAAPQRQLAKELGFDVDTTWYHGTNKDFDIIKIGGESITQSPAAKEAFFLTDSPKVASQFAEFAGLKGGSGSNVIDTWVRPENIASIDASEIMPLRTENGQRVLAGLLQDAKDQGLKAVYIKNAQDSITGQGTSNVLAVLDPAIVRSKRAKFDKTKKLENGLMLGVGATGVFIFPELDETGK